MNLSVATAAARPCKDSIPRGRVLLDLTMPRLPHDLARTPFPEAACSSISPF